MRFNTSDKRDFWCDKCAKYLAFGTFATPYVDALMWWLVIDK